MYSSLFFIITFIRSLYRHFFIVSPHENDLHDSDNHNGVIPHPESDILECEVNCALRSITMNKASGGDGIPVKLFQILKDDAVKMLHSICHQIWKTQQGPQDWKRSVFIQSQRQAKPKNDQTTAQFHSSHMLVNNAQNSPSQASAIHEPWTSRCWNWF